MRPSIHPRTREPSAEAVFLFEKQINKPKQTTNKQKTTTAEGGLNKSSHGQGQKVDYLPSQLKANPINRETPHRTTKTKWL